MSKYPTSDAPTAPSLRPVAEPPTQRLHPRTERSPAERPAADSPGTDSPGTESPAPAKAVDLTINKVIAGAGAAATSAVLGSYFGAAGTVTGAAFGSVASTIASVIYQHSLDRTRDRLVARVRVTPGRKRDIAQPEAELRLPAPRVAPEAETVQLRVEPDARPSPRRVWLWAGATVIVFVIGLLAVTGVEWAKGSSLTTGESGTSVGRVIEGNRGAAAPTEKSEPPATQEPTPAPTQEPTPTPEPTQSAEPNTGATEAPTPSRSPESGATQTPGPSESPGFGGGSQGGGPARDGQRTPEPTPLVPAPQVPGE